jgi:hypothetical protein
MRKYLLTRSLATPGKNASLTYSMCPCTFVQYAVSVLVVWIITTLCAQHDCIADAHKNSVSIVLPALLQSDCLWNYFHTYRSNLRLYT